MEQNQLYNEIFFEKNDNYELEKSARKRLNIKAFQLSFSAIGKLQIFSARESKNRLIWQHCLPPTLGQQVSHPLL